jgi:hypothetical protein
VMKSLNVAVVRAKARSRDKIPYIQEKSSAVGGQAISWRTSNAPPTTAEWTADLRSMCTQSGREKRRESQSCTAYDDRPGVVDTPFHISALAVLGPSRTSTAHGRAAFRIDDKEILRGDPIYTAGEGASADLHHR